MKLDITERLSFAAGTPFGETGPYERLKARFHGAVDPAQQPTFVECSEDFTSRQRSVFSLTLTCHRVNSAAR